MRRCPRRSERAAARHIWCHLRRTTHRRRLDSKSIRRAWQQQRRRFEAEKAPSVGRSVSSWRPPPRTRSIVEPCPCRILSGLGSTCSTWSSRPGDRLAIWHHTSFAIQVERLEPIGLAASSLDVSATWQQKWRPTAIKINRLGSLCLSVYLPEQCALVIMCWHQMATSDENHAQNAAILYIILEAYALSAQKLLLSNTRWRELLKVRIIEAASLFTSAETSRLCFCLLKKRWADFDEFVRRE